jgi:hypothetical protein
MMDQYPETVISYECHVSDVFATSETSARATWYGVSGIPHVRCDGLNPVIGAGSCGSAYNQYLARYNARMNATEGNPVVDVSGGYLVLPSTALEIQATALFEQVEPSLLSNLRATIIVYQDSVMLGNNQWDEVVRDIYDENVTLTGVGDQVLVQTTIPVVESPWSQYNWVIKHLRLVAYLQNTATREIYQAAHLHWENAAGVGDIAAGQQIRLLYAEPNPFRPLTRIGYSISSGGAIADLGVFDLSGRRVATLFKGTASEGIHEAVWMGGDDRGNPLASGVYFVRLIAGGETQVHKVIRLE